MKRLEPFYIILSLVLFNSCGVLLKDHVKSSGSRQHSTTNSAFNSHIISFEQTAKAQTGDANFSVGDIPINFGDTENPAYEGVCFEYTDGTKEIIIKESWWKKVNDKYRESLIYHELGHCRLGREHQNEVISTNSGTHQLSMMSSTIISPADYQGLETQYWQELFTSNDTSLISTLMTK